MYYGYNGLFGILVLIADIWAIVNIFQSGASTERKVLWTVLVILLPLLGFLIWLFAGPAPTAPDLARPQEAGPCDAGAYLIDGAR